MRRLTAVGLWLLAGGIVLNGLGAAFQFGEAEGVGVFFGSVGGSATFAGIVVLIVAAVRGRSQQQQQQVVVVTGGAAPPAPAGPQVRCPACRALNAQPAAFCGECGAPLGRSAAPRSAKPAAARRAR